MKEIGSEFWLDNTFQTSENKTFQEYMSFGEDSKLLFSGRTAIEYVLEDIKKPIKTVYMPSYCCSSMIQPFLDRSIEIEYYEVQIDNFGISYVVDFQKEIDLFFAASYFGFSQSNMDLIISKYKEKEILVIEDITHRLLSENNFSKAANYCIASVRKWVAIPSGGLAIKSTGAFSYQNIKLPSNIIINNKIKAMEQKYAYINTYYNEEDLAEKEKRNFSNRYSKFNNELNLDYKNYSIDKTSELILLQTDINKIKHRRIENAEFLYKSLNYSSNKFRFLFNEPDFNKDCPLFIPILLEDPYRYLLKKLLIENKIFCPSHWPNPDPEKLTSDKNPIYVQELSIICDQRYGLEDMQRIVGIIKEFDIKYA